MALSKLEFEETNRIAKRLSSRLDVKKDLPAMVFRGDGLEYYFFERPLFNFTNILNELVCSNYEVFSTNVFALFNERHGNACYLFDGQDVGEGIKALRAGFRDFFNGTVSYPMVMGNLDFDWLVFESAYEEYGVLALNSANTSLVFSECLRRNLISSREFQSLRGSYEVLDKIIEAFREYFETP